MQSPTKGPPPPTPELTVNIILEVCVALRVRNDDNHLISQHLIFWHFLVDRKKIQCPDITQAPGNTFVSCWPSCRTNSQWLKVEDAVQTETSLLLTDSKQLWLHVANCHKYAQILSLSKKLLLNAVSGEVSWCENYQENVTFGKTSLLNEQIGNTAKEITSLELQCLLLATASKTWQPPAMPHPSHPVDPGCPSTYFP